MFSLRHTSFNFSSLKNLFFVCGFFFLCERGLHLDAEGIKYMYEGTQLLLGVPFSVNSLVEDNVCNCNK